jgi:hypothetical protein
MKARNFIPKKFNERRYEQKIIWSKRLIFHFIPLLPKVFLYFHTCSSKNLGNKNVINVSSNFKVQNEREKSW